MCDFTPTPAENEVEYVLPEQPMDAALHPAEPVTVVDVHFRSGGKVYFFDPGDLQIAAGDHVIIDTSRGIEYGICSSGNHTVPAREIVPPLRKVLRLATAADEKIAAENAEKEARAYEVCLQKIAEQELDMQLVSAECAFDGSKILFFFTADGRVDFRELVKSLAAVFRTRIELRQIGVRDKAKMVGGLGACGRPFCCSEFLDDFQPVSIKMAKVQNLSLNPTKISGTCGRLMCCLKYEQEAYEDLLRTSPKNESFVDTPEGRGTVTEVNLLKQSVKVRMEDHPEEIHVFKNCDICVLRNGKARKNDPPIPPDLAPISQGRKVSRSSLTPEEHIELLEPVIIRSMPETIPQEDPQPTPSRRSRRRRKRTEEQSAAAPAAPQEAPIPEPRPAEANAQPEKPHRRRRNRGARPENPEAAAATRRVSARPEHPEKAEQTTHPEHSQNEGRSKPHHRRYRHRRSGGGNSGAES